MRLKNQGDGQPHVTRTLLSNPCVRVCVCICVRCVCVHMCPYARVRACVRVRVCLPPPPYLHFLSSRLAALKCFAVSTSLLLQTRGEAAQRGLLLRLKDLAIPGTQLQVRHTPLSLF